MQLTHSYERTGYVGPTPFKGHYNRKSHGPQTRAKEIWGQCELHAYCLHLCVIHLRLYVCMYVCMYVCLHVSPAHVASKPGYYTKTYVHEYIFLHAINIHSPATGSTR